jgi:hypothetical protein
MDKVPMARTITGPISPAQQAGILHELAEADDLMRRLGRAQAQADYLRASHLLDALRRTLGRVETAALGGTP